VWSDREYGAETFSCQGWFHPTTLSGSTSAGES
jgi:hypothetical protein